MYRWSRMGVAGSNDRSRRAGGGRTAKRGSGGGPGTSPPRTARRSMRFVIPSDFIAAREVQEKILNEVERGGYHSQNLFAIKLALEEGLINAIKHGNKLDPAKQVRIEAVVSPGQVEITIEDQGAGFERCCVPDPTREENLQKCSGRGILLIEAYMDHVEYSKGGRRLHMVKKNQE